MADSANHLFLPWVQPGAAAGMPNTPADTLSSAHPTAISLPVRVVINADAIDQTLRVYGPGDVTGIDPQQVVRVEPRHGTNDFEPNYFPAIEFDRPDLPWLFTPLKAGAQARLRPWLCLVVVRKQAGVEYRPAAGTPLPVLAIARPAVPRNELPDLAESHFWAHAQVTGSSKADMQTVLQSDPARTVSRLLCPRHLQPSTDYIACVVPTFDVGRRAGLNLPIEQTTLEPAWRSGKEAPEEITLPVYYAWEFRTSAGGDFEELVRRLEPRQLPSEVGKRTIDISRPGFAIDPQPVPGAPRHTLGLEGALHAVDAHADAWPDATRVPFQKALADILNTPDDVATGTTAGKDPIVAPPLYGAWHAATHRVNAAAPRSPRWFAELNLDPRHRAIAALATRVVQQYQEQLMASAWEQLGDIQRVNQRLRQAQLSRAVNERYHAKTFSQLPMEAFIRVVSIAQSRLAMPTESSNQEATNTLMVQSLSGSMVPPSALSAPLRKIVRPRGPLGRMYSAGGDPGVQSLFALFNSGSRSQAPAPDQQNRHFVTIDQVSSYLSNLINPTTGLVWNPEPPPHWERPRAELRPMINAFVLASLSSEAIAARVPPPTTPPEFVAAVKVHHEYLTRMFAPKLPTEFPHVISAEEFRAALLTSLIPSAPVNRAAIAPMAAGAPAIDDELEPIMDQPTFPQPMYEALRDLSQDYLFPGLEHVPPNTVHLLQTNAPFIESFMVGLNAEMGRELLWRDYPTDQRGTYFQQFWGAAGAEPQADIIPIHRWGDRPLGTTAGGHGDKLVLLIRGDLLRRYPGTVIYAVRAVKVNGQRTPSAAPADERYPVFRGTLEPDVTFVGFPLTAKEVVTGDGWYFVMQQQPTEPRFGLDDDPFAPGESGQIPALKTWSDLNWAHLAAAPEQLAQLTHVGVRAANLVPSEPVKGAWGRNGAHMAYITKQLPVRVAIHATELMP